MIIQCQTDLMEFNFNTFLKDLPKNCICFDGWHFLLIVEKQPYQVCCKHIARVERVDDELSRVVRFNVDSFYDYDPSIEVAIVDDLAKLESLIVTESEQIYPDNPKTADLADYALKLLRAFNEEQAMIHEETLRMIANATKQDYNGSGDLCEIDVSIESDSNGYQGV